MSSFERSNFHNFNDELSIDTPEQVQLSYNVAGIGSRFVAILLDTLIIAAFYVVAVLALLLIFSGTAALGGKASAELDAGGKWVLAIFIFLNFLLIWGYFALFEAFWHGQTPGKRAMKLRVIKDSGRQITFFESLARNLLRFVDYLPSMYLIGVITMLCNQRHKRLGDFAAATIVVHERADEQPLLIQSGTTVLAPVGAPAAFASPPWHAETLAPWAKPVTAVFPADAVARLDAQDLVVIEAFFARMLDLPLETRTALAYKIAGQMAQKMGVALPEFNPERTMESIAFQMRNSARGR